MTALLSRALADTITDQLKVYAQPQRLMILWVLKDGEQTVSKIEELTGIGQPTLSQQLAELRRAGLVVTWRTLRKVHYRLASDRVALSLQAIEEIFGSAGDSKAVARPPAPVAPARRTPHSLLAASFAKIL